MALSLECLAFIWESFTVLIVFPLAAFCWSDVQVCSAVSRRSVVVVREGVTRSPSQHSPGEGILHIWSSLLSIDEARRWCCRCSHLGQNGESPSSLKPTEPAHRTNLCLRPKWTTRPSSSLALAALAATPKRWFFGAGFRASRSHSASPVPCSSRWSRERSTAGPTLCSCPWATSHGRSWSGPASPLTRTATWVAASRSGIQMAPLRPLAAVTGGTRCPAPMAGSTAPERVSRATLSQRCVNSRALFFNAAIGQSPEGSGNTQEEHHGDGETFVVHSRSDFGH